MFSHHPFLLLILSGVSLFYYVSFQPDPYVIFASYENLTSDLREALLIRFKSNNILYQIDSAGNNYIPESRVETAKKAIFAELAGRRA